jgi:hypothetical protein
MNTNGMSPSLKLARVAVILAGGALALWIATGVTLNFTLARQYPSFVDRWWPAGVSAAVVEGNNLLASTSPSLEAVERINVRLHAAALREPVNTYTLSTLGAIADYRKDRQQARTFFRLAESASRRNIVAELWLIEDAVERGDISEAIGHYDRAMRVSIDSRASLLPVLLSAASDPAIMKDLRAVLVQRPLWWEDYVQQLAANGEDTTVMSISLDAVKPDLRDPAERGLAENTLRRMVALKDERGAVVAANRLEGLPGSIRSLRDGNFETADGVLPFAWWLRDEENVRTYRDTVPNGSVGLWIVTSGDTSGGAAQQLIGLSPGRYTLSGSAGDVPTNPLARPAITMSCGNGSLLTRFALPPSDEGGRGFRFQFDVPPTGCQTQWVTLLTAPATDTSVWIDNLAISR